MEDLVAQARQEDWPAKKLARRLGIPVADAQALLDDVPLTCREKRQYVPKSQTLDLDTKIEMAASGLTPQVAAVAYNCTFAQAAAVLRPTVRRYDQAFVDKVLSYDDSIDDAQIAKDLVVPVSMVKDARSGKPAKVSGPEAVAKCFEKGLTRHQAVAATGLSYATVQLYWPVRDRQVKRADAGTRQLALELLKKHTQEEVARQLGVAQSTIHRWRKGECSTR
jgi:hypothetical protein